jgi:glycosyltransferase involved in cell wall biosynthesis
MSEKQNDAIFSGSPGPDGDVSIITPFHNTGAEFLETADSLSSQTLKNWKWIIVDDGTTSAEALSILDEGVRLIKAKGCAVEVIKHAQNEGPGAARNTGIKIAKGRFVFFLDSDDVLEPTCLEKSYWYLLTHPEAGFVGTWPVWFGARDYVFQRGFNEGAAFLRDNLSTVTVMLRRSIAVKVGGFDTTWRDGLEDWDFWLKCASSKVWGQTIPEALNKYRRRTAHSDRWSALKKEGVAEFVKSIPARYPNLTPKTFPKLSPPPHLPNQWIRTDTPVGLKIPKSKKRRILFLLSCFETDGAGRRNLDIIEPLTRKLEWETTLAATACDSIHSVLNPDSATAFGTPDFHILQNYIPLADYPRYLRWLLQTREPDVVCIINSRFAYSMLPVLRAWFPRIPFVDYVHEIEEEQHCGGYAADSIRQHNSLLLTGVASEHLKKWMIQRGGIAEKIRCVHANVNSLCHADEMMSSEIAAMFEEAVVLAGQGKHFSAMRAEDAEVYANEIIEQYRLLKLTEKYQAGGDSSKPEEVLPDVNLNEQFRNSVISPKFSRTKRNILRFLMRRL